MDIFTKFFGKPGIQYLWFWLPLNSPDHDYHVEDAFDLLRFYFCNCLEFKIFLTIVFLQLKKVFDDVLKMQLNHCVIKISWILILFGVYVDFICPGKIISFNSAWWSSKSVALRHNYSILNCTNMTAWPTLTRWACITGIVYFKDIFSVPEKQNSSWIVWSRKSRLNGDTVTFKQKFVQRLYYANPLAS